MVRFNIYTSTEFTDLAAEKLRQELEEFLRKHELSNLLITIEGNLVTEIPTIRGNNMSLLENIENEFENMPTDDIKKIIEIVNKYYDNLTCADCGSKEIINPPE